MDLRETNPQNRHRHPWELARAASLLALAGVGSRATRYADIGAGDLFFTQMLAARSDVPVVAVDTAFDADSKGNGCILLRDVAGVPHGSIDCMYVMDVLEHVDDDGAFARTLACAMAPGGRAVFTVPAHPGLFSSHDDFLGHRRRYTRAMVRGVLEGAGFEIEELFSFYLVPLAARGVVLALQRLRVPLGAARGVGNWPLSAGHVVSRALILSLRADFAVNRACGRVAGMSVGLSLCAVCAVGASH